MPEKIELSEFVTAPRGRVAGARSEDKLGYDNDVADAHKSGKPLAYVVRANDEEVEAVEKAVRNSVNYLKLGTRKGAVQPGPRKGTVVLSWLIVDRVARPRKATENAE